MTKKAIHTDAAPRAIGPYSQAVLSGTMIFVSGQIGLNPASGELVSGGIEKETERAIQNLEGVLKAAGAGLDNVIKVTVFVTDMSSFSILNHVYSRFFKEPFPARAVLGVSALPLSAVVEIEALAVLD